MTPPKPCEPGPNEFRNDAGQCVCKRGFERDKIGRCVIPPKPKCEPGPNEFRNDAGQCVCKRGSERDKNGRCVTASNPAEDCKRKGGDWDGRRCVEPSTLGELQEGSGAFGGKTLRHAGGELVPGTVGTPPNCKPLRILKCLRNDRIFPIAKDLDHR